VGPVDTKASIPASSLPAGGGYPQTVGCAPGIGMDHCSGSHPKNDVEQAPSPVMDVDLPFQVPLSQESNAE
jgi:hypothetical protein